MGDVPGNEEDSIGNLLLEDSEPPGDVEDLNEDLLLHSDEPPCGHAPQSGYCLPTERASQEDGEPSIKGNSSAADSEPGAPEVPLVEENELLQAQTHEPPVGQGISTAATAPAQEPSASAASGESGDDRIHPPVETSAGKVLGENSTLQDQADEDSQRQKSLAQEVEIGGHGSEKGAEVPGKLPIPNTFNSTLKDGDDGGANKEFVFKQTSEAIDSGPGGPEVPPVEENNMHQAQTCEPQICQAVTSGLDDSTAATALAQEPSANAASGESDSEPSHPPFEPSTGQILEENSTLQDQTDENPQGQKLLVLGTITVGHESEKGVEVPAKLPVPKPPKPTLKEGNGGDANKEVAIEQPLEAVTTVESQAGNGAQIQRVQEPAAQITRNLRSKSFRPECLPPNIRASYYSLSTNERSLFQLVYGYNIPLKKVQATVKRTKKTLKIISEGGKIPMAQPSDEGDLPITLEFLHMAFEPHYLTDKVSQVYTKLNPSKQAQFRKLFFLGVPNQEIPSIIADPTAYRNKLVSLGVKPTDKSRPLNSVPVNTQSSSKNQEQKEEEQELPTCMKSPSSSHSNAPNQFKGPPHSYHQFFDAKKELPPRFVDAYKKLNGRKLKGRFRTLLYYKVPVDRIMKSIFDFKAYEELLEQLKGPKTELPALGVGDSQTPKGPFPTLTRPVRSPGTNAQQEDQRMYSYAGDGVPAEYHENFNPYSMLPHGFVKVYRESNEIEQKRFRALFYHKVPLCEIKNHTPTKKLFERKLNYMLLKLDSQTESVTSSPGRIFDPLKVSPVEAQYYSKLGKGPQRRYRRMYTLGYSHLDILKGIHDPVIYNAMVRKAEGNPQPLAPPTNKPNSETQQTPTNNQQRFCKANSKTQLCSSPQEAPSAVDSAFQKTLEQTQYLINQISAPLQIAGAKTDYQRRYQQNFQSQAWANSSNRAGPSSSADSVFKMTAEQRPPLIREAPILNTNLIPAIKRPVSPSCHVDNPPPAKMSRKKIAPSTEVLDKWDKSKIVYVSHVLHPRELLTVDEMSSVQQSILDGILEMEEGQPKPSFFHSYSNRFSGQLVFYCNDRDTVDWLRSFIPYCKPWSGAQLRTIVGTNDARCKALAILPKCSEDDDKKILQYIEKQNSNLNVSKWSILNRNSNPSASTVTLSLLVDRESAITLFENPHINFKLGRAIIKVKMGDGGVSDQSWNKAQEQLPSGRDGPLQGVGTSGGVISFVQQDSSPPMKSLLKTRSPPSWHQPIQEPLLYGEKPMSWDETKSSSYDPPLQRSSPPLTVRADRKTYSFGEPVSSSGRPSKLQFDPSPQIRYQGEQRRVGFRQSPSPVRGFVDDPWPPWEHDRSMLLPQRGSRSPLLLDSRALSPPPPKNMPTEEHRSSVFQRLSDPPVTDREPNLRDDPFQSHSRWERDQSPVLRNDPQRRFRREREQSPDSKNELRLQSRRERERSPVSRNVEQRSRWVSERSQVPRSDPQRRCDRQTLSRRFRERSPRRDADQSPFPESDPYIAERSPFPRSGVRGDPQPLSRWVQERSPEPRDDPQHPRRGRKQLEDTEDYLDRDTTREDTARYGRYDESYAASGPSSSQPSGPRLSGAGEKRRQYLIQCGLPANVAFSLAKKPINRPQGSRVTPAMLKEKYEMMTPAEQLQYVTFLENGMTCEEALGKVMRLGAPPRAPSSPSRLQYY